MNECDEEVEDLIERSSLGNLGAQRLRGRTPSSQVEAVRRIADLRNQMAHSGPEQSVTAARTLVQRRLDLGYEGQAEVFPGRETEAMTGITQTREYDRSPKHVPLRTGAASSLDRPSNDSLEEWKPAASRPRPQVQKQLGATTSPFLFGEQEMTALCAMGQQ